MNTQSPILHRSIIAPIYRDRGEPALHMSDAVHAALCKAMDRVAKAGMKACLRRGTISAPSSSQPADSLSQTATIAVLLLEKPMAYAAIAKATGLSKPSCSSAMTVLRRQGKIRSLPDRSVTLTPTGRQWLVAEGYTDQAVLITKTDRAKLAVMGAISAGATTARMVSEQIGRTTEAVLMRTKALEADGYLTREMVNGAYVYAITTAGREWMGAK